MDSLCIPGRNCSGKYNAFSEGLAEVEIRFKSCMVKCPSTYEFDQSFNGYYWPLVRTL